jgi:hypothetical protein
VLKATLRLILMLMLAAMPGMARPVRFMLDMWKENPATYTLTIANYQGAELVVKRQITIEMAVESKGGDVTVLFRPSGRRVVEARNQDLAKVGDIERMVDAFLYEHPITMSFTFDGPIDLNREKSMKNAEKFHKRYPDSQPPESLARQIPLDAFKREVYVTSEFLIRLFANPLIFSTEFQEGKTTYRYPPSEPTREMVFELVNNLYGCFLTGEGFALNDQGKPVARHSYRFEFSSMLDTLNAMRLEVLALDTKDRTEIILTR